MDTVKAQDPGENAQVAPGSDVRLTVWAEPIRIFDVVLHSGLVLQPAIAHRTRPRELTAPIAPARCKRGFVHRFAFEGDRVCVTPATRQQVLDDNAAARDRVEPDASLHAYGPATCRQGFVWREARDGDLVCVTPVIRTKTREDNQLASSRQTGV
jgi:hypothetical protein